jgi:hypothetical protein
VQSGSWSDKATHSTQAPPSGPRFLRHPRPAPDQLNCTYLTRTVLQLNGSEARTANPHTATGCARNRPHVHAGVRRALHPAWSAPGVHLLLRGAATSHRAAHRIAPHRQRRRMRSSHPERNKMQRSKRPRSADARSRCRGGGAGSSRPMPGRSSLLHKCRRPRHTNTHTGTHAHTR